MASRNRKCICCQDKYNYCPNCSRKDALEPSWKAEFCSETCKDLWLTLTKFGMDILTKSEAQSIISELDLKSIDTYVPCVQRDYAKVMTEDKKPKRGKRIEISHVDEVMDIEPVVVESIVEELIEIKPEQHIIVAESAVEASHEVVITENE